MAKHDAVTDSEREIMFQTWISSGGSIAEVRRKTGRSRDTIYRVKAADNWDQRRVGRARELQRRADLSAINEEVSNLKRARDLLPKVVEKLQQQLANKDFLVKVHDAVELMRYVDELGGNLGPTETEGLLAKMRIDVGDPDEIQRLLRNCLVAFSVSGPKSRDELE